MKEIANFLHITSSLATSLVNFLVKRGFIIRTGNEFDRRTIRLDITVLGQKLLKSSFKMMTGIMENNINKLNNKENFFVYIKKIS